MCKTTDEKYIPFKGRNIPIPEQNKECVFPSAFVDVSKNKLLFECAPIGIRNVSICFTVPEPTEKELREMKWGVCNDACRNKASDKGNSISNRIRNFSLIQDSEFILCSNKKYNSNPCILIKQITAIQTPVEQMQYAKIIQRKLMTMDTMRRISWDVHVQKDMLAIHLSSVVCFLVLQSNCEHLKSHNLIHQ